MSPLSADRIIQSSRVWLPFVVFLIYAATAQWRSPINYDVYGAALEGWALATTGAPWLDGLPREMLSTTQGDFPNPLFVFNGEHAVSSRTIGAVLAATPFAVASSGGFVIWPSTLSAVLLATAAVVFMHRALLTTLNARIALAGTLVFAFATPTWSVSADSLWTHSVTQVGIAAGALAVAHARWWWAGVGLGVAMTGRLHVALIAAVLGLGLGLLRRSWRIPIGVGVPTLASLVLVVATNRFRYGEWSLSGGYSSYAEGNAVDVSASALSSYAGNLLGYLASPDRGLLVWTPMLLVLVPAAVKYWRRTPDWSWLLALGGLFYAAFQLKINYFAGGDFYYGYRHGLELITAAFPLLAFTAAHLARRGVQAALLGLVWLQFAMVAMGAVQLGRLVPFGQEWSSNAFVLTSASRPILFLSLSAIALAGWYASLRVLPDVMRSDEPADAETPL